jgi:hypothetical protein
MLDYVVLCGGEQDELCSFCATLEKKLDTPESMYFSIRKRSTSCYEGVIVNTKHQGCRLGDYRH